MKGRNPTKKEKMWMSKAANLGCIVCFSRGYESPAEIHHIDGKTKDGAHFETIGLCARHHRLADNKPKLWISRHGDGLAAFEAEYDTEQSLLLKLREIINEQG